MVFLSFDDCHFGSGQKYFTIWGKCWLISLILVFFHFLKHLVGKMNLCLVMFTPGKEALHWNWLVVAPCSLCRNRQEGRQKKGNHDWRLEPEKEPLSRNYKSAKCIIKSLCMQAHPIILRGLHVMSLSTTHSSKSTFFHLQWLFSAKWQICMDG